MARLQALILELLKAMRPAFRLCCDPLRSDSRLVTGVNRATLVEGVPLAIVLKRGAVRVLVCGKAEIQSGDQE